MITSYTISVKSKGTTLLQMGFPGTLSFTQTSSSTIIVNATEGDTLSISGVNSTSGTIDCAGIKLQIVKLLVDY